MPRRRPPTDCPSPLGPKTATLSAGSVWWRVHGDAHEPVEFRNTGAELKRAVPARHGEDGRFDCQAGEYGYISAAATKGATLAEAFLRGPVIANPAARFLRRAKLDGRVLSRLELTSDLSVVDLRGAPGLGRVGQDAWLTSCDEVDYPLTQEWATGIRRWAPGTAGILWMSKRDNVHEAIVLFDDAAPKASIEGHVYRALTSPLGLTLIQRTLAGFNVTIR